MKHMHLIHAIALCLFIILAASSCSLFPVVYGSGNIMDTEYTNQNFTKVEGESTFDITVVYGTSFGITITTDDNLAKYVVVSQSGDRIFIRLKSGYSFSNATFQARLTLPDIDNFSLSGASRGRILAGFPVLDTFGTTVSGASRLDIDDIDVTSISLSVSGASTVMATGGAAGCTISCSGASSVNVLGCQASSVNASVSGASTVSTALATSGSLSAGISGASRLNYRGDSVSVTVRECSGASSIVRVY